jgi:hypothetical protein
VLLNIIKEECWGVKERVEFLSGRIYANKKA